MTCPSLRPAGARPGIALLLVLATLVLAVTAAVALARVATAARLEARDAEDGAVADRILRASEVPILDWLHRHSRQAVLPLDSGSPRFLVADDVLEIDGRRCRLTISAFDQCGMAPARVRCGAVDSVLPPHALDAVARADEAFAEFPGLDLLRIATGGERPVFPTALAGRDLALGELLATHNPPRAPSQGGSPVLNINTAPMAFVEAVYAARGLGTEAVIEARAAGRPASPGATDAPRTSIPEEVPVPVAASSAWAFRIDCHAGRIVRSWWCVYINTGSNWERVQRVAIDE